MYRGALIAESMKPDAQLDGFPLTMLKVFRVEPPNVSPDQPGIWTVIEFEAEDALADALAARLTELLDQPGWYCDFRSESEHVVAFPGRFFRYRLGDADGRAEAQAYGLSVGVPQAQLDWQD